MFENACEEVMDEMDEKEVDASTYDEKCRELEMYAKIIEDGPARRPDIMPVHGLLIGEYKCTCCGRVGTGEKCLSFFSGSWFLCDDCITKNPGKEIRAVYTYKFMERGKAELEKTISKSSGAELAELEKVMKFFEEEAEGAKKRFPKSMCQISM